MTKDAFQSEVSDRLRVVKGLHGGRWDDRQLEEVRKGVETMVRAALVLRAVQLENGDEPYWGVTPYREEG